jgi:ATP-dependent Clp protease ATP-binding subunit ClpA
MFEASIEKLSIEQLFQVEMSIEETAIERLFQELFGFGSEAIAPPNFFRKCTRGAIDAMQAAQAEANRLAHSFAGTEEILLGLLGAQEGLAGRVLRSVDITLEDARAELERANSPGEVIISVSFSAEAQQVFSLALSASKQLNHNYIGTEHLLLGLLQIKQGGAVKLLTALGIEVYQLEQVLRSMMQKLNWGS